MKDNVIRFPVKGPPSAPVTYDPVEYLLRVRNYYKRYPMETVLVAGLSPDNRVRAHFSSNDIDLAIELAERSLNALKNLKEERERSKD